MRILVAAVLCAIVCITAIAFSLDAIKKRLDINSATLLGGDRVINSPTPLDPRFKTLISQHNLHSSEAIIFYTMLSNAQDLLLASVKAVDANYPLLGELKTSLQLNNAGAISKHGPNMGEIWLESRAMIQLNVNIGDTIHVGDAELLVSAILTAEPDRIADGFTFAPRALMNINDIAKTKAILPGSRVAYKLLLTGAENNLNTFDLALQNFKLGEYSVQTLQSQSRTERNLDLASNYLSLALAINFILSAITVIIAANRYSTVHTIDAAILRCLGASRKQIILIYGSSLVAISILIGVIGSAIGYGIQATLSVILVRYFNLELATPGLWPMALGIGCALVLVLLFGLPAILALSRTSPVRVLHKSSPTAKNTSWRLHLNLSTKLPPLLRLSINNILYNSRHNLLQILTFALIICVATILFVVRADLLKTWQSQIPKNVPNYFAINIPTELAQQYAEFLAKHDISVKEFYPIIRGELTKINNEAVSMEQKQGVREGIHRPLNLTWTASLPYENKILAGHWFKTTEYGQPYLSIENEMAQRLNVNLGDTLTFKINDEEVTAAISSIRTVVWGSFTPNFYVIYNTGLIENVAYTYMTSFYMSPDQETLLLQMVRQFPQINIINVTAMLDQAQTVLGLLSMVIAFIWVFTLSIGILLLFAILLAGMNLRLYQNNLMRIFGAARRQLLSIFIIEYLLLGGIAGGIGSLIAIVSAKQISKQYFTLYYPLNWWIVLCGILIGMLIMLIGGMLGAFKLFNTPPIETLRHMD